MPSNSTTMPEFNGAQTMLQESIARAIQRSTNEGLTRQEQAEAISAILTGYGFYSGRFGQPVDVRTAG